MWSWYETVRANKNLFDETAVSEPNISACTLWLACVSFVVKFVTFYCFILCLIILQSSGHWSLSRKRNEWKHNKWPSSTFYLQLVKTIINSRHKHFTLTQNSFQDLKHCVSFFNISSSEHKNSLKMDFLEVIIID